MNLIKSILQTTFIVALFFLILEFSLYFFFGYRNIVSGDINCKIFNSEENFSSYRTNCKTFSKNWEQKNIIEYSFNNFGRREIQAKPNDNLLAFIGDSFTFGSMVPIEKNYNFKALEFYKDKNYVAHNYGVAGEQFHNILSKLKKLEFQQYKFVIYGITPNDLFDIVDKKNSDDKNFSNLLKKNYNIFNSLKKFLLRTSTSRALMHNLLSNDKIYFETYLSRKPYSGYLMSPLPEEFNYAIDYIFNELNTLDKNLKNKLILLMLPQRAEVVAYRLNKYNNDFHEKFINECFNFNIKCGVSNIENLSKIKESHFPVDGHLTIEGNEIVAKDLLDLFKKNL